MEVGSEFGVWLVFFLTFVRCLWGYTFGRRPSPWAPIREIAKRAFTEMKNLPHFRYLSRLVTKST